MEAETYFEVAGTRNPETKNELINQIINTQSTYNLRKVFEEATISPSRLIKYTKKAAQFCDSENPIVWQHLHTALSKKGRQYKLMPSRLARMFGHFSEDERKTIINEMARCVRNHRSEQLTPSSLRTEQIDPKDRERYVWKNDKSVLVYQHGAGANVFASVKLPQGLLDYDLPDRADTRFVYWDADSPIEDSESHLHERTVAIKSIQRAIAEDLASDNPILDKFFTRFTLGDREAVPEMPPPEVEPA